MPEPVLIFFKELLRINQLLGGSILHKMYNELSIMF
jgi:hypothetical protein